MKPAMMDETPALAATLEHTLRQLESQQRELGLDLSAAIAEVRQRLQGLTGKAASPSSGSPEAGVTALKGGVAAGAGGVAVGGDVLGMCGSMPSRW